MKIKEKALSYDQVMALPREDRGKPRRPSPFFRLLLKTLNGADLKATHFQCRSEGMERLGKDEPALFLMNHSSFIDLKIAASILYPRPFNIVCTSDGFVGKRGLMYAMGCIPAQKFVTDLPLVRDMLYAVRKLGNSILLFPEASYTFDGTATPLPQSVGKLLKTLKIPVVMIKTSGAFLRDPLYNMLQLRQVDVSATMRYVLSPEDIRDKSVDELNGILRELFTFDNFREQQEKGVTVDMKLYGGDGLVFIVNTACGVENVTLEDLRAVYRGEITNWNEVGGNDGEIVLIGREAGSGTRDGFESITGTEDACKYRQELTSTGDVITTVAGNPNAIGYASMASVNNSVKAISVGGVAPSEATIKDGSYAVQRPFVLVTKTDAELSETAKKFFDYITSADANEIITSAGVVPAN